MFSGLLTNAWEAATLVAVVAGVVGFFTVARGSAFAAHALPNGAFAGAAGATVLGMSTLLGLGVFAAAGALGIAALGRRARHDVATALAVVSMLALGALFLSLGSAYAPAVYALLFGQVLGVSEGQLVATAGLGAACLLAVAALYRPLLLSSVGPEVAEAGGVGPARIDAMFLLVLAGATTMAVPVVGALLIFTLMVSPPAAARLLTDRPATAMALSVAIALITVWAALALSYWSDLPTGFFVGAGGAVFYAAARLTVSSGRRDRARRSGCG